MIKKLVLLFFMLFSLSVSAFALDVPALTGPVVDNANILDARAKSAISTAIVDLFEREGIQFQVLIIPELTNETIEGYSIKVVDQWKLGKTRDDRAALFLVSINDKKMRIEVGRGLEGTITDLTSGRILAEVKKYFKQNDYANGVALGLSLMARADGKDMVFSKQAAPRHKREPASPLLIIFLIIVFVIFNKITGGRAAPFIIGSLLGGGLGGSGGRGGGGGWSGGGGGFSGGGASGDW